MKIVGPNIIEYPEYDGNSMYRTLGNISRNPNVGLLFVRFDGKSKRMRVNGRASILEDAEAKGRHFGAQLSCAFNARSIRTVPATCPIWPARHRRLTSPAKGRVHLRRPSGSGATTSRISSLLAIRMRRC